MNDTNPTSPAGRRAARGSAVRPRGAGRRHAAAVLLPLLVLGGCSAPLPSPSPEPVPAVAPPAVSVAQAQRVLDAVAEVVAAGDAVNDAAGLAARLEGPALAIRTAEYVRNVTNAGARPPTVLPFDEQALLVPETDSWPRTQLVVTEQPADLQAPRVLVLRQATPREPYRLWGWARLLPSVQTPATAAPEEGSPTLPADAEGLLATPLDAVAQYADVLANGDASPYVASFAPDAFRAAIEGERAGVVTQLGDAATLTQTYAPVGEPVVSLGTVDGGAIVVSEIATTSTVTLPETGGSITVEPFYSALAGGATTAGTSLTRIFSGVVVMYVPPADSGAQIQILAGEQSVTGASAS
ncbi:hypothetical protein [Cellulomonas phragmiteti]|uniref:DUF8094 domain-containing protein n=1 Tax=Cellulomonas phragmiteti TaxID=478780 RepID=A0ABQ4DQ88_9CELL|nr:hypothetical protein [Cellulomonas phragmiteti]GIG41515.1 hypothetical protein Cph01nite_32770 [Cellulomonas phragmiteti]